MRRVVVTGMGLVTPLGGWLTDAEIAEPLKHIDHILAVLWKLTH